MVKRLNGMEKYKIDKNINIDNYRSTRKPNTNPTRFGTKFSNTMHLLNIGESFHIKNKSMKDLHSTFSRFNKNMNKKFSARTTKTGIRIWRIK